MKILVAGSKGFIGRHCVAMLRHSHEVWGCDIADISEKNYVRFTGASTYAELLAREPFDVLVNASGSSGVGFSYSDPEKDRELNTGNVRLMLDAVRAHAPACRFINFSSAAIYGNPLQLPIREDDEPAPLSPYGFHKLEAEQLLQTYHREDGIASCSLRVFSAYGPDLRKQLFWDIYQKACAGKTVTLFGTGSESRDFIFIDDIVRAVEIVATRGVFSGECINVASGTETTIREAATLFLEKLQKGHELRFNGEVKEGDPLNWRADISRLAALGFSPLVAVQDGIARTARGYALEK